MTPLTISTPTFKSFLGLNLRTGCFIFGYTKLAFQIIITIVVCVLHAVLGNLNAPIEIYRNVIAVAIVLLLLTDCFTISLLVGLHMNSRAMVKIFLVYMGVSLVLAVMVALPVAVVLLTAASIGAAFYYVSLPSIINVVVAGITCCLPQIYFYMLLTSHYHHMGYQTPAYQAQV